MELKSKYMDIILKAKEKEDNLYKLSDIITAYALLNDMKIEIPTICMDDTIDTILDVYYHTQDTLNPRTISEVVDAYVDHFDKFGCDAMANYDFVQDSDKYLLDTDYEESLINECPPEIDIDDAREWED